MERAEEHHRALCAQLTATSTTSMERAHLLASGLAAEIRAMAAGQREDLRLAMRLPPVRRRWIVRSTSPEGLVHYPEGLLGCPRRACSLP